MAPIAQAQDDAANTVLDGITVIGVRSSIERSIDDKRIGIKKSIGLINDWDKQNVAPAFPPLSSWSGNP